MTQTTSEIIHNLNAAAKSGEISTASKDELSRYAAALCHSQAFSELGTHEFTQVCETVRIHLLRAHIESLQDHVAELHGHITKLNKKNSTTQYCVIALTVMSLIGSAIQIWYAEKSDQRSQLQPLHSLSTSERKSEFTTPAPEGNPTGTKPVPQSHKASK